MTSLGLWVWVGIAGGAGAVTRFVVDGTVLTRTGGRFPLGTAVANLTGALALGVIAGASGHTVGLVLGTGFIGAYTTFSTWMLETVLLGESGRTPAAVLNLVGQLAAGLALAGAGFAIGLHW